MMKYTLVLGLMAACEAFVALPDARIRSPARFGSERILTMVSSSSSSSEIPTAKDLQQNALSVQLTANNFELTPPLKEHTLRAVEAPLSKFSMMTVQRVDVHLSVIKHHQPAKRSRAEVTVIVDGNTLRRAEESDDMYAAVDMLSHSIRRALGKLKRKQGASSHQTFVKDALNGQEYADLDAGLADEDEVEVVQEEVELEWPKVTKIKSFDLSKTMTLEDAVFALDFVDHDFYVFRNVDTNQINVIYRRHGGRGVGLIQPEQDD